ncbi:MAG: Txe/YoeB family addiction module toxin [Flexibacteraceae bacterium]
MRLIWAPEAWDDYLYWQSLDKKILKKINELIKDTLRHPSEGLGKPERLKSNLEGCWSRRISDEHRLVYVFDNESVTILMCRYHYNS